MIRYSLGALFLFLLLIACVPIADTAPTRISEVNLRGGELRFDLTKASADSIGIKPAQGCWPSSYFDDGSGSLTLSPEGILAGTCKWTSGASQNPQVTWSNWGDLRGILDKATGKLSFTLATRSEYPENKTVIDIKFTGNGQFIDKFHAEGLATYITICQSKGPIPGCSIDSSGVNRETWEVNGSVPWNLDFSP